MLLPSLKLTLSRLCGPAHYLLMRFLLTAIVLSASLASFADEGKAKPIKVGTFVDPPFVENENGRLKGFTVELWEPMALHLDMPYTWKIYSSPDELLSAVSKGEVDVAAADLSITSERHKMMDFSHPYFETGLRIMINENRHVGFGLMLRKFIDTGHVRIIILGLIALFIVTLIVMALERRFNKDFPKDHAEAFAESLYHVVSVILKGQTNHKPINGAMGRFFSIFWMICGVSTVSYMTAVAASVMTTSMIHQHINNPSDLAGKSVATIKGSTASIYLSRKNLQYQTYSSLNEAADALCNHFTDAIVYDAPALEYYDRNNPEKPVTVVGTLFEKQAYGLAYPPNSSLRRKVDGELLRLRESGDLERLRTQYFGDTR